MISATDIAMIGVICAIVGFIFSLIFAVLFGRGVRIGRNWIKLKESELQSKPEELAKADLQRLIAGMDDTKHRLDEVQKTLNEIRDLLRSTV
jgi:cell division protein FtsW (lipid II flippase)